MKADHKLSASLSPSAPGDLPSGSDEREEENRASSLQPPAMQWGVTSTDRSDTAAPAWHRAVWGRERVGVIVGHLLLKRGSSPLRRTVNCS